MREHNRYPARAQDGVDPGGWAAGLRQFVDGRYRVVASDSFGDALRSAVTSLRQTNLPVGLTVAHGNHAWVLTGFTATADPLVTDDFRVTSVRVDRPAVGAPEPHARLRHAPEHEAHAGAAQRLLHALALRADPDGVGGPVGLGPAGGIAPGRPPRRGRCAWIVACRPTADAAAVVAALLIRRYAWLVPTSPDCAASNAASIRVETPSLSRMWVTWTLAVLGVMNRASPISRLVRPSATSARTSSSRRDSPNRAPAGAGVAG